MTENIFRISIKLHIRHQMTEYGFVICRLFQQTAKNVRFIVGLLCKGGQTKIMRGARVDFSKKLREWDGFGVNYVETAQTPDYDACPQDYGGFGLLQEEERQEILDRIFGENGLKPGIVKMFLDPFHQKPQDLNQSDPGSIDPDLYDHRTSTRWMRYFVQEGLRRTRIRGKDLQIIATLYGPPGWMTKQGFVRGRDLNPLYKVECAKYMIAWAKFLREGECLPVTYISLHNEGESYYRWPDDGSSANWGEGHDYNLYWPPEQVTDFLRIMRGMLDRQGMKEVGLTPGETTNLYKFHEWGYADAIVDDEEALSSLGLITSHGFSGYSTEPGLIRYFSDHRSLGIDTIREKRPHLHCWITSTSWGKMDVLFLNQLRFHIYSAKVNGIIPWAVLRKEGDWKQGDPNPGTAFKVYPDKTYSVESGYYYYKQVCTAGQPGMSVARVHCNDSEIGLMAFGSNGTQNPDAFIALNLTDRDKDLQIEVLGSKSGSFQAVRTSCRDRFSFVGEVDASSGYIRCKLPPLSATTYFGGRSQGNEF